MVWQAAEAGPVGLTRLQGCPEVGEAQDWVSISSLQMKLKRSVD